MALPNPIPDNPLRWDGWRNYNSPNLYHRLCLEFDNNVSNDIIEENTRILLVWWQKKLPLKNQPSNPMAQMLRQGLDEAPHYLAEARTRLLDPEERARHDAELHEQLVQNALTEFRKLLAFTLASKTLSEDSEARLLTAGAQMGLRSEEMLPVIESELERSGSRRISAEPLPPPPPPVPVAQTPLPAPSAAAPIGTQDPASEFRRILKMSRLCLDGEEMTDDQRDAMCNMGESLGLTGGQAEDLIDEYLDEMASAPMPANPVVPPRASALRPVAPATPKPASAPAAPQTPKPPGTTPQPAVHVVNLSPIARADERKRYPNYSNSVGVELFLIPSGRFEMGSTAHDSQSSEQPVTSVILTGFYMSRFPITNAVYEKFDPTHRTKRAPWADDNHPVIYVSAAEAEAFCKWLSNREGKKYRLPTEAEWEYAARGPTPRNFPWGDEFGGGQSANFADSRTSFPWRDGTIDDGFAETSPVGSFPRGASAFGIEDMAGNVFEWCVDSFEPYKGKEVINPRNIRESQKRVYRGGSWKSRASSLRCSARNFNMSGYQSNDVGFRIVCELE
ncbi:MAG: hypothetical protein RL088_3485 [Verrucomicrobiota bacterium]